MRAVIVSLGLSLCLLSACGPSPQSAANLPTAPGTSSPQTPSQPPPETEPGAPPVMTTPATPSPG